MRQGSARVPFTERGGHLRGVIDLATGVYPAFLFGGTVGRQLPVFHIHEVTPASLEPHLRHIAENGYRTLVADEIDEFIRTGRLPAERSVSLTFDDARASLWTVAAPLLRRYGLRAITFAVPGRLTDAIRPRPTLDDGNTGAGSEDASETPFVTWVELKMLQASGTIDVQAHSLTHIAQFCSSEPVGFVTPAYASEPMLTLPSSGSEGRSPVPPAVLAPLRLRSGHPLMNRPLAERGDDPRDVTVASTCALLLDRAAAIEIGLFDERYFIGKEDGDFTHRCVMAGYRILELPQAQVFHYSRPRGTWLFYYQIRNRWHFMLKNYQVSTLLLIVPPLILHEALQAAVLIAKGHAVVYFKAVWGLIELLPDLRKDRAVMRRIRKRRDADVLVTGSLIIREDLAKTGLVRLGRVFYEGFLNGYWRLLKATIYSR